MIAAVGDVHRHPFGFDTAGEDAPRTAAETAALQKQRYNGDSTPAQSQW